VRDLHEDEVLRLALDWANGNSALGLGVAGASLSGLNDLVAVMAANKYGNLGERGPVALPPDLEPLDLVDFAVGSAVFFLAPGRHPELALPVDNVSRITSVVDDVLGLIEAGPEHVVSAAQQYHPRVAAKYVDLLDTFSSAELETSWRTPSRSVLLPGEEARESLQLLERTEELSTRSVVVVGTLYEANARSRGFRLERTDDESIIVGRFASELVDEVGALWNQVVIARIDVTTERLVRTNKERLRSTLVGLERLPQYDDSASR
jgi:hypothetical protein